MTSIPRTHARVLAPLLLALLVAGLTAGCGKKGPPLAPIVATPQRITGFAARRFGNTVHVRLTIPDVNLDGTKAKDLERIDVYAYTAKAPADFDDIKLATLVASIQVRRPVTAEQEESWAQAGVPPPPNPGEAMGSVVDVTETLTPDMVVPITPKKARRVKAVLAEDETGPHIALPLTGPVAAPRPKRYYIAQGVSRKGIEGPLSGGTSVCVWTPPPPPPGQPQAVLTETAVELTWTAPPEQRAPIQEPATVDLLPATPKGAALAVVYAYNVYLTDDAPTPAGGDLDHRVVMPVPVNPAPLAVLTFLHAAVTFGSERCYVVRSLETIGDVSQESDPSPASCLSLIDTFPPPPPTALAAVASEGAISLIWEGVDASDLDGYIVLRSEGPDAPLTPLFEAPIKETTYRDATAKPGVRYVYAVASVDTATPRNVSAPSNRIEEAAR